MNPTKSFNFSTLCRQYGNFIKWTSDVAKKEDERKTKLKKQHTNSKHKNESYPYK
jgi:hypothetical protein